MVVAVLVPVVSAAVPATGGNPTTLLSSASGYGQPVCDLIADSRGNLYGTTEFGSGSYDYGTVFSLSPVVGI